MVELRFLGSMSTPGVSAKKKTVTAATMTDAVKIFARHDHRYPTGWKLRKDGPYLPVEIIFNILLYVPAKVLHEVARYVCKQWYDIVSDPDFITTHCRMSSSNSFLIQHSDQLHKASHIEPHILMGTLVLHETPVEIPFCGAVVCCFNGLLVLLSGLRNADEEIKYDVFYVVNPVTKVIISLPHLTDSRHVTEVINLAVDSSGHYKVVHVSGKTAYFEQVKMRVFTIGVDKAWRFIDLRGIPAIAGERNLMLFHSFCFGGFMYWFTYYTSYDISPFGFALEVDTEIIYPLSIPKDVIKTQCPISINMGTCPGLVTEQDDIWRVWKLTDVKSSEWTELTRINMRRVYSQINNKLGPIYFLDIRPFRLFNGHLWLRCLRGGDNYVVVHYDLTRERFKDFRIKKLFNHALHPYANTLVSPKN
ncbi:hypothetical protein RND81_02G075400 [Saponaria officinalis]|uniref:F-box domain-containing protein n=1 Tax=Saponaria officinalis TaxID=3572 RepID=A0AAW1MWK9_SAPOF